MATLRFLNRQLGEKENSESAASEIEQRGESEQKGKGKKKEYGRVEIEAVNS